MAAGIPGETLGKHTLPDRNLQAPQVGRNMASSSKT